jgi:hypothetical protein
MNRSRASQGRPTKLTQQQKAALRKLQRLRDHLDKIPKAAWKAVFGLSNP